MHTPLPKLNFCLKFYDQIYNMLHTVMRQSYRFTVNGMYGMYFRNVWTCKVLVCTFHYSQPVFYLSFFRTVSWISRFEISTSCHSFRLTEYELLKCINILCLYVLCITAKRFSLFKDTIRNNSKLLRLCIRLHDQLEYLLLSCLNNGFWILGQVRSLMTSLVHEVWGILYVHMFPQIFMDFKS